MTRPPTPYIYAGVSRGMPTTLHRVLAEKALGKPLPAGAVVHHLDGNPRNNANTNLVICPDENYHNLLHIRLAAYQACGNADYLKCYVCKEYDSITNLHEVRKAGRRVTTFYHSACRKAYRKQYRENYGVSI